LFKGESYPFFQAPVLEVKRSSRKDNAKKPRTKINAEEADIVCLRLAKAGYGGGDPEKIGKMAVDWVMKIVGYEGFCSDYEEEYYNLNQENNG
jgi:hypothetical protein